MTPDELLGLHKVDGDSGLDVLPLGDDSLGYLPDDRGFDHGREDSVLVDLVWGDSEMAQVSLIRDIRYRWSEFSSSRVRSPSSRTPSTAASQAFIRMAVCRPWGRLESSRDWESSFRWVSGSWVAMAANRASSVSRSVDAFQAGLRPSGPLRRPRGPAGSGTP